MVKEEEIAMGYNEFGNILKQVREHKGLTIVDLQNISGVSKRQIYRIERDNIYSTTHTIAMLSNALGVNLSDYMNVYNEFNSIVEYEEYVRIRKVIENRDEDELRAVVNKYLAMDINNIPKSTFKQVLLYAIATFYSNKEDYEQSQRYLFKALNIKEYLFEVRDVKRLVSTEFTFVVYTLIEYNYFMLNKPKKALKLAKYIIEAIEDFYFSKNLTRNTTPKIIVRSYININNNLADNFFENKDYEKSIEICNKIIEFSRNEDASFHLEFIYLLLFKNYAKLNNTEKAYFYLQKTCFCIVINENIKFKERILSSLENEYKDYKEKFDNDLAIFLNNI